MTQAKNKNWIQRFFSGLSAPLGSFKVLKNSKRVFLFSLFPFLITIGLLFAGYGWLFSQFIIYGEAILASWLDIASFWGQASLYLLYAFTVVLVFVVVYLVASIVSIPFNSIIAEEALKYLGAYNPPKETIKDFAKRSLSMLRVSLYKSVFLVFLGLMIFIISVVPAVSGLALFLSLLIFAFDCADYSLEILNYGFRQRIQYFRDHLPELSGLALALAFIFIIPIFNFMLLPIAVISGALLFKEG